MPAPMTEILGPLISMTSTDGAGRAVHTFRCSRDLDGDAATLNPTQAAGEIGMTRENFRRARRKPLGTSGTSRMTLRRCPASGNVAM